MIRVAIETQTILRCAEAFLAAKPMPCYMLSRILGLFVSLVVLLQLPLQAQLSQYFDEQQLVKLEAVEDTLGVLGYAIVNDSLEDNRFLATSALIPKLVEALKTPNSFHYPFEQLRTISIQYPADSTFRIFTWQLYVDKDTYRYYGAIQMNTPELELYALRDRSFDLIGNLEQQQLVPENWYGAVYYNLKQVNPPNAQPYYLLFGFDGFEFFRKRKVVDVLRFAEGKPIFGAPVFVDDRPNTEERTKERLVLQYSAEASIRCNYDEALDLLIFDHLQVVNGQYGEGMTAVSDGTYEAYKLEEDGYWHYVEKVFNRILDEPLLPEPVLGTRSKNIIGGRE